MPIEVNDTKNQQANLLWIDDKDSQVIKLAFNESNTQTWLTLPSVTSRKRQIGPAIQNAIAELK